MSRYIDADYIIKKIESRIGYFNQYYPDLIENIGELETCKDFINDALMLENRMTTEKAINILYGMKAANLNLDDAYTKDKYEALEMAIKALEQEPCEDTINKQAAIDALSHMCSEDENGITVSRANVNSMLKAMPPVTPKPKIGHWIDEGFYAEGHSEHAYRCSECDEHYIGYVGEFKHCPNCGARMGKESKE